MDRDKSNNQLTLPLAEDVKLANGQDSCQIKPRLNALPDHLPFVTADRDNLKMDTHARLAQLDKSKA